MKKLVKYLFILLVISTIPNFMFGQYLRTQVKGKSATKRITYRTKKVEENSYLQPKLEILDYDIFDDNLNRVIERGESASIELQLINKGDGTARDVYLNIKLVNEEIEGLEFKNERYLGNIYSGNTRTVIIPIQGSSYLNTGIAQFNIEVFERFGRNINPINIKIGTHEYHQPEIVIKDARFSTDEGGRVKLNYPIYLKVLIENVSPRTVKNLEVDVSFENSGCVLLDDSKFIISSLESNQPVTKEIIFTAKQNYPYDIIPIKFHFHDKYKMYSEKRIISMDLNQLVAKRNPFEIEDNIKSGTKIYIADVDTSIPYDTLIFKDRYAFIIGNEDYKKYQPSLSSESNVIYATNDAIIFRKYAINTLGIPKDNVFLLLNATYAEMKLEIERVSKIIEKTGENAELIFYYAGHGFPDETTKAPYLIPVDVSASNLQAAIKLSDIYKSFSNTGARMITMFIDACFTGGGRESGLIAARAFTMEPKYEFLSGNMVVFNSSSGTQSSLPYHDKKHGIFTYFILKKLQETRGYITYGELSEYVCKKVSIESLRVNSKEQDPKVNISSNVKNTWQQWSFKKLD